MIVVFGAGIGLGTAVARRFGRAGHRVALVARGQSRLDALVGSLAGDGIEAEAFAFDLSETAGIPGLIGRITQRLGPVDIVEYAPITTAPFVPATELDAATMRRHVDLYLSAPIEIVRAVLPGMLERGDGGILLGQGVSATHPMPYLSGVGPAMAAARNYIQTLNGELADKGVYAGVVHVAGMILGSAGHAAMTSGELAEGLDLARIPTVDPADIAETMWTMLASRDRFEAQIPSFEAP